MTELLEQAFAAASRLPESEQDTLGRWLLAELASERKRTQAFGGSSDRLTKLAEEALEEYRAGKTDEIDPDRM